MKLLEDPENGVINDRAQKIVDSPSLIAFDDKDEKEKGLIPPAKSNKLDEFHAEVD